ncbi:MAG TPA: metalloregulator ArsR/SmtB family transcription factor [Bacteroidota bacterium]|nr:metalloregulator ArsR/SmtB family transcription factor [Bacteroidota bacterium]
MNETDNSLELLTLLKALADKNRLKIIGTLAQKPLAVEDLSSSLKLSASTVSHHLSVLAKVGLVTAKAEGYYSIYSLQEHALSEMAKRLLQPEKLKKIAEDSSGDDYDKKVLATFTDPDGRINAFPVQEKKFLVLLRYVLRDFERGIQYTEKQVNEILARFNRDTAKLRRYLVEHKFMAREGGGGKYWRIDQ